VVLKLHHFFTPGKKNRGQTTFSALSGRNYRNGWQASQKNPGEHTKEVSLDQKTVVCPGFTKSMRLVRSSSFMPVTLEWVDSPHILPPPEEPLVLPESENR
jgi:hypothetical protein